MENDGLYGSPLQARAQTALRVLPGNQFNGPAVDLLEAPADLVPPRFLGVRVHLGIQTVQQ